MRKNWIKKARQARPAGLEGKTVIRDQAFVSGIEMEASFGESTWRMISAMM